MTQPLSYSLHGRRLLSQVIPNPAAGAEVFATVPANVVWELTSFHAFFTAAAGGGNRRFSLAFTVGLAPCNAGVIHDTVPPGGTNAFHWLAGFHEYFDFAAVNETYQGLPQGLLLAPGDDWRTVTINLQAADQWSAIAISYFETIIN